ncbi:tetratricopeptide repeat protein [Microcoleus vaginatus PCC 9802]|uniref:CheR family methyltransferase n=1 Tax=Microcoleus vaginatus TaxID=119532 RepID=UPI00020D2148|nr:MCP methyltransferase, CheR-type [Microcoleus vaginatus FGP-2]UNU19979.1 tetratricopeptide repeat protein [Microcoleus vaginatus PCC 9802]
MNDSILQLFINLITTEIGVRIRFQDREGLSHKIMSRMRAKKIPEPEKYYKLLTAKTFESKKEWAELVLVLTTIESYFMRDKGQFALLKKVIFPELIEQKRNLHKTLGMQPTLRIWSAGCSTGEEPYSLAIVLKQLIPDWEEWKILILGTDINEKVIKKAPQGVYSHWSFRLVEPQIQKQYFYQRQNDWHINQELRPSVTFSCVNLITDEFPSIYQNLYNIDLILCRNVFVYFEHKYISLVLKKFSKTLRPGGYLMTGHAEVYGQIMNEFQPKIFPESVVYQRRDAVPEEGCQIESRVATVGEANSAFREFPKPDTVGDDSGELLTGKTRLPSVTNSNFPEMPPVLTISNPLGKMLRSRYLEDGLGNNAVSVTQKVIAENTQNKTPQMLIFEAKQLFKNQDYAEAINKAQESIDLQGHNFDAYFLIAQVHANAGNYSQAIEYCNRARKVDPGSVLTDYLQAHIAEEQGQLETAKNLLKRTIYMCPSFVSAYIELGNIYNKEGQVKRAIKMYNSSCEILKALPQHTPIDSQGKMTANQLLVDVKKKLLRLYSKETVH